MSYRKNYDEVLVKSGRNKRVNERHSTSGSSIMASIAKQVAAKAKKKKPEVSPKPSMKGKTTKMRKGMSSGYQKMKFHSCDCTTGHRTLDQWA